MADSFRESAVEEAALEWSEGLGYTVAHGSEITVDGPKPERASCADVVLVEGHAPGVGKIRVEAAAKAVGEVA
jgi:type I restriction enzyme, R subunit